MVVQKQIPPWVQVTLFNLQLIKKNTYKKQGAKHSK